MMIKFFPKKKKWRDKRNQDKKKCNVPPKAIAKKEKKTFFERCVINNTKVNRKKERTWDCEVKHADWKKTVMPNASRERRTKNRTDADTNNLKVKNVCNRCPMIVTCKRALRSWQTHESKAYTVYTDWWRDTHQNSTHAVV